MSAAVAPPSEIHENDLFDLYNDVLAGFSNGSDLDIARPDTPLGSNLGSPVDDRAQANYHAYIPEQARQRTLSAATPSTPTSPSSRRPLPMPAPPPPPPLVPQTTGGGSGPRRLPPVPGLPPPLPSDHKSHSYSHVPTPSTARPTTYQAYSDQSLPNPYSPQHAAPSYVDERYGSNLPRPSTDTYRPESMYRQSPELARAPSHNGYPARPPRDRRPNHIEPDDGFGYPSTERYTLLDSAPYQPAQPGPPTLAFNAATGQWGPRIDTNMNGSGADNYRRLPPGAQAGVQPGSSATRYTSRPDSTYGAAPEYSGPSQPQNYDIKRRPDNNPPYTSTDPRLQLYNPAVAPARANSLQPLPDDQYDGRLSAHSSLHATSSNPPPSIHRRFSEEEDANSSVGALLMRSSSDASNFSSLQYGDLKQPIHQNTKMSIESGGSYSSYPTQPTSVTRGDSSSSAANMASPDQYLRSQSSFSIPPETSARGYPTPPIVTTPPEPTSSRRRDAEYRRLASMKGPLELHEQDEEDFEEEEDDNRFVNLALLSHLAVRLRDKVPRGTHVKGSIPYPRAFTGKDIVTTIQSQIQRELASNQGISNGDRRLALQVARSLQSQLFFYEVEWGGRVLNDGVEDVFMFLDDTEGPADDRVYGAELPTGVVTMLTRCYSASCNDGEPCYAYSCPRRAPPTVAAPVASPPVEAAPREQRRGWADSVDPAVLITLPESEVRRQSIISKVIKKEEQYVQDLDIIESLFIQPLRRADPPLVPLDQLDEFIEDVFGNIQDLKECNKRLLDVMYVRQREQFPIIQRIGDIFLTAAADFRTAYPIYVGHLPVAEKRLKEEIESNAEFRRFLEQCSRHPDARRMDLKTFITRPVEHLNKYPVLLEAIFHETADGNPDADFLIEAEQAIRNLSTVAQLRTFQSAMGRGPTGKFEWHDLVSQDMKAGISKSEAKRQSIIFELIKTEMVYVKDLETIETLFIRPLRNANPPIVARERLTTFINDVFHNFAEIHRHHRRMLERLHDIQREEHPVIRSITAPVFDAALNWRDAYMEYIPHYPIAAFRIDEEMANNLSFKTFVDQCMRHPDSRKLDMKAFINRPIPRLLRYDLLLRGIMDASPTNHDDRDSIPQVLEVIKDLGKATEPGVTTAKQKVELWRYHANLVWKAGEAVDMDLLDETRTLVHTGKLLRQPETGFEWSGWTELFVLLFDNYLVMTKPKEKDGVMKYYVNRRPIPLELLSLPNFNDPPQQRGTGILRLGGRGGQQHPEPNPAALVNNSEDSRYVYPCHMHHNGRMGGLYTVYAESTQARLEWKQKLEEAMGLRHVVQESNKVFEVETLSLDTFLVPSMHANPAVSTWNGEDQFTGKVTCSVPFSTADGRGLVAIGCAEGVWIGLRHDARSMRRVLHLKQVTQCAMLEDFGIFLVLADKSLFAYHIEALVPSMPPNVNASRTPQKLNGNKDVQFFSVGTLGGRTLIIYMKKKGLDSVFRVLEPVVGKIAEKSKNQGSFGRFNFGGNRSEWFRVYRDFFLPSESFDLIFLKAKIAILCTKGFEIMDLTDFKSVTIPQREDPRLANLAKRCESCRPLGMFRSSENEFLLCYDEFGLYVDRHGDPSRTILTIEWEGTAERVACHPPYILLFDSRFIEVRHIDTGRLAQIIPGNEVRCLWDGRGANVPPVSTPGPDGWQEAASQEARVHAVMKASEPPVGSGLRPKAVAQHVFELVPTIPLYLPGSLASPTASTYFPPGSSPPHSPRLTAWR